MKKIWKSNSQWDDVFFSTKEEAERHYIFTYVVRNHCYPEWSVKEFSVEIPVDDCVIQNDQFDRVVQPAKDSYDNSKARQNNAYLSLLRAGYSDDKAKEAIRLLEG